MRMTVGKEAAIVLKTCQAYDGDNTVADWVADIRALWQTRQIGGEQRTYQRVQSHAKSIGLDISLEYELNKLKVTIEIKK